MAVMRKRPVEVEAHRWFPGEEIEGVCFCSGYQDDPHIHTLEGIMCIRLGDWVITGVRGEKYPCKHDIFMKTYEPVVEDEETNNGLGWIVTTPRCVQCRHKWAAVLPADIDDPEHLECPECGGMRVVLEMYNLPPKEGSNG